MVGIDDGLLSAPAVPDRLADRALTRGRRGSGGRPGRHDLSQRTRSDLMEVLDGCANGADERVARPAARIEFLRPRAVRDHLGCVACASADLETRRWFFFFETETNHDPAVRALIRAAGGLCAPHTRHLLDSTSAAWLARGLFSDVLRGAAAGPSPRRSARQTAQRLTARSRSSNSVSGAADRAGCPVCAAVADRVADTLTVLDAALATGRGARSPAPLAAEAAAAYRAGPGLCVGHARAFLQMATSGPAAIVADQLAAALGVPPEQAVGVLVGGDDDAPARARTRETHARVVLDAAAAARRESFDARVRHLIAQPCCPVCAARDRATWRLLDWLGGRDPEHADRDPPDAGAMREQLIAVCARHLADLVSADGGGAWMSATVATVARLGATRAREAAAAVAAAAAGGAGGAALRAVAARSGPRMSCPVCTWSAEAAAREVELIRLVAVDARWTGAIAHADGLCARCLSAVVTGPGDPWSTTFATRTRQLSFELGEAVRADSWSSRWDTRGAELSSWQRAPFLLDGAVLGPRPPVGGSSRPGPIRR
jgi:hypothetical protein